MPRRSAEAAKQEILEAAASFLSDHPYRDLTVGRLMERTQIGRSAFYAHFKDLPTLCAELLLQTMSEMRAEGLVWFGGEGDLRDQLHDGLSAIVRVWSRRGRMLRAIIDAAPQHENLERMRLALVAQRQGRIADRLRRELDEGRIAGIDPAEIAVALHELTTGYLNSRFSGPDPADDSRALDTLHLMWSRILYGSAGQVPTAADAAL
jgi:AcrR family transcriptional regulator